MKLIDFYADWCGPCRTMKPAMEQIASEYPDLVIEKVDAEEREDLATDYNVRNLPTLIFLDDLDNVVDRTSGGKSYSQIKEFIDKCLSM